MSEREFEQVVQEHYASLHRFALSLARNEADARDLTQQTCYLWATKGHQLRDSSRVRAWLMTTLHREFLRRRRHQTRFPHLEVASVEHELPTITPDQVEQLDAAVVFECLGELDEAHRVPLTLFYLDGISYKEIAAILEIPIGTVMSRLARGKEQLRRHLTPRAQPASATILKHPAWPPEPSSKTHG